MLVTQKPILQKTKNVVKYNKILSEIESLVFQYSERYKNIIPMFIKEKAGKELKAFLKFVEKTLHVTMNYAMFKELVMITPYKMDLNGYLYGQDTPSSYHARGFLLLLFAYLNEESITVQFKDYRLVETYIIKKKHVRRGDE